MALHHWRHSSSESQIKGFVVDCFASFLRPSTSIQGLSKSSCDLRSDIWTKHCGPSMMWLLKPRHQIESKSSITMSVIHRFFSLSIVLGMDQAQVRCWTTILDLTSAREPSTSAVRFRLLGHNAECCSFVLRRSGEFSLAGNICHSHISKSWDMLPWRQASSGAREKTEREWLKSKGYHCSLVVAFVFGSHVKSQELHET